MKTALLSLIIGTLVPVVHAKYCSKTIVEIAADAGTFETLGLALSLTGLNDTLSTEGPFTVFAPTDTAFNALPAGTLDALVADPAALADILTYHVLSGEVNSSEVVALAGTDVATVNGATVAIDVMSGEVILNDVVKVITTDIEACNGIIHVIDTVLIPPSAPSETPTGKPTEMPKFCSKTIVEIAADAGTFETLGLALSLTGLDAVLSTEGPFTVFAPTDTAFNALPAGTLDALVADPAALAEILTYHVVSGKVSSSEVVALAGTDVGTVNGATVAIDVMSGEVILNDVVKVITTDIEACNGIIHVIDTVLIPPSAPVTHAPTTEAKSAKKGKKAKGKKDSKSKARRV